VSSDTHYSFIGGGQNNLVGLSAANTYFGVDASAGIANVICGGANNTTVGNGNGSFIGGGAANLILTNAHDAVIPGGKYNVVNAAYCLAAGQQAQAMNNGSFVWADSQNTPYASTTNDSFNIRAQGNVHLDNSTSIAFGNQTRQMLELYRDPTSTFIYGIGVQTATLYQRAGTNGGFAWYSGGSHSDLQNNNGGGVTLMTLAGGTGNLVVKGTVTQNSDRNLKTNLVTVDSRDVLERLAVVPMMKWTYKTEDSSVRHLGPMAQDFQAAFHLGEDDKHITTVDEGGVALAAIQGLNQKIEEQRAENTELKQQLAELKALVEKLASTPAK